MFKKMKGFKTKHQILFAIIIGFAVVAFWRGVWGILDTYLFPNNYELSSWVSLISGLFVLIVTRHAIKELM
jgi:hypothetical protein|tara:strand:- start:162 stop:374 length:213 start_codon:yes stop_codon:yes gene_type:complete